VAKITTNNASSKYLGRFKKSLDKITNIIDKDWKMPTKKKTILL
jgi:hypothetical protein